MKRRSSFRHSQRASALMTVVFLTTIMALLTASMLKYTMTERRGNERNRLILRTKNTAENISIYGAEQITTKLYRLRSTSNMAFMGGTNQVDLPPASVLKAADSTYASGGTSMEILAGITGATGLQFIDPATSPNDPNAGLQVNTANVPIITKATGWHPSMGNITAYTQQDLAVDFVPLFQFAVFYNMDLEVWPGADMTLAGPVHANGEISARSAPGFTATISFLERVSTPKGFYANANKQGDSIQSSGAIMSGDGGDAPVNFRHSSTSTTTAIKSGTNVWRDHKYGTSSETTTTQNNFKVFATTTYGLNLRTSVHGVTELVLPSVSGYSKTDDPATSGVDERDNGRQIIDHPISGESGGISEIKISRRAGLYIIVNPDDEQRTGYMADGTTVLMRARSYRCWLNTVNSDLSHTMTEVILPGQPSYGPLNAYVNNLPNAYRTDTAIGHNQVLRTIFGGGVDPAGSGYAVGAAPTYTAFSDAYFYDLRRAKNNSGLAALGAAGSFRNSNTYAPRPIIKIDFDMIRFRMCVERTVSGTTGSYVASDTAVTIFDPSTPNAGNWARSIYNTSGAAVSANLGIGLLNAVLPSVLTQAAPDPYRMYFAPANPTAAATITAVATTPGAYAVGGSDLVSSSVTKPWYDGLTVYIQSVDAEVRALTAGSPQRIDSGVRLWNGRGAVVSLDGTTYPNKTGFTFCTNDAAYIIGHFNADGSINSTTTATGNNGYSARYPDSSSEKLTAVMADAITILSQPVYATSGGNYYQSSGWSDSLSSHRNGTTWVSNWATTQPSGTNGSDGEDDSLIPANLPWQGYTAGTNGGSARTTKFDASTTEISTCLMVGIVPTNHNPTGLTDGPPSASGNGQASGGLHNFPRLSEVWGSAGLYIRGSMVAMFESRVAMEPWTQRAYSAPARTWGLHESLRSANHDLPLEPILLGARRLGFKEITAAQYTTMKATITALPH